LKTYIYIFILLTACSFHTSQEQLERAQVNSVGDTVTSMSKSILIVYQAVNGEYWFGSDTAGVYRYDGKYTIHYSTRDGLSSDRIRGIQEDREGNIYFATLGGINKFDGEKITYLTPIKSQSQCDHWKFQDGDLWFCMPGKNGDNGPYRYDGRNLYQLEFPKHFLADDYFKSFPNNAWSPYEVYSIYKDSKDAMWFGTSNFGVCRYDGKSFSWLYEDHLTNVPGGGSFGIRSILEDSKGKYWFCNSNYRYTISQDSIKENDKVLVKYEKQKGIEGIYSPDGTNTIYFLSVVEDNTGNLWMATYNDGIWKYDGKQATMYPVKVGKNVVTVFSIYKDKKGDLWLGTHANGVFKFDGKGFVAW
jgi:ligand-binding sensor domain-containing protein